MCIFHVANVYGQPYRAAKESVWQEGRTISRQLRLDFESCDLLLALGASYNYLAGRMGQLKHFWWPVAAQDLLWPKVTPSSNILDQTVIQVLAAADGILGSAYRKIASVEIKLK